MCSQRVHIWTPSKFPLEQIQSSFCSPVIFMEIPHMNYGCSSDKHQDRREMTAGAGVSEEEDGGEGVAWTGSRPVLAGGGMTAGRSCNQLLRVIIYQLMLEICLATMTRYALISHLRMCPWSPAAAAVRMVAEWRKIIVFINEFLFIYFLNMYKAAAPSAQINWSLLRASFPFCSAEPRVSAGLLSCGGGKSVGVPKRGTRQEHSGGVKAFHMTRRGCYLWRRDEVVKGGGARGK